MHLNLAIIKRKQKSNALKELLRVHLEFLLMCTTLSAYSMYRILITIAIIIWKLQ